MRKVLGDASLVVGDRVIRNPISSLGPGGALGLLRHHLAGSALGESVRHRYGRSCISAPKPTIPSMINTSSPITIQPCNAVMFSSFELMVLAQKGTSPTCSASDPHPAQISRWSGTHRDHMQGEHDVGGARGNPPLSVGSIPAIRSPGGRSYRRGPNRSSSVFRENCR
jgi:hypothetical protein